MTMNYSRDKKSATEDKNSSGGEPVTARRALENKSERKALARIDWEGEEVRKRDKRLAAVHEAAHVFVGDALSLQIVEAQLRAVPDGGIESKHWIGSVRWRQFLEPEEWGILPPQAAALEGFKWRMYSLAGLIGEEMCGPSSDGGSLCRDDVMDSLADGWDDLSETDRAAFPEGFDSVCEREVQALLRLLEEGREVVSEIADKLEEKEFLGRNELDELPRFMVFLPGSSDLADFDAWRVHRL